MKYIVVLGDGMADYPLEELNGKTPLQYADTPNMDRLAEQGEVGLVKTVPDNMPAGSDVANLSVLGYDPQKYYTGRSPLEAVAMGIDLSEEDVAFRCNLVTLSEEEPFENKRMMDHSADEISTEEAAELIKEISQKLENKSFIFYPGMSYRHLLVWRNADPQYNITLIPPHDISGQVIGNYLPRGNNGDTILNFMVSSSTFLPHHPVNIKRQNQGRKPANSIWIWGEGRKPRLDSFKDKYSLQGAVVSAVDLVKGIGLCAGLNVVEVPGATGNIQTNFKGKASHALKELQRGTDFIFIHIEAPDEAGHRGEVSVKIKAIEEIDKKVLGELLPGLNSMGDYRLMLLTDHPTPISVRTHTHDPVPFCIFDSKTPTGNSSKQFSESEGVEGSFFDRGSDLMEHFLS